MNFSSMVSGEVTGRDQPAVLPESVADALGDIATVKGIDRIFFRQSGKQLRQFRIGDTFTRFPWAAIVEVKTRGARVSPKAWRGGANGRLEGWSDHKPFFGNCDGGLDQFPERPGAMSLQRELKSRKSAWNSRGQPAIRIDSAFHFPVVIQREHI